MISSSNTVSVYSYACAVADPDTDTVILTGGWGTLTRAWRYSTQGLEAELPSLGVGRFWHGCAGYREAASGVRRC